VTDAPTIPLIRLFDYLSIQVALSDDMIEQLTLNITDAIERSSVSGLILDFSGTDVVDSHISRRIRDLAVTARLMGVYTVVCGLRAPVVITLVEMGLGIPGVRSTLNLERALELLLARDRADEVRTYPPDLQAPGPVGRLDGEQDVRRG
jgi:rsbT antagonist protein RsbS